MLVRHSDTEALRTTQVNEILRLRDLRAEKRRIEHIINAHQQQLSDVNALITQIESLGVVDE